MLSPAEEDAAGRRNRPDSPSGVLTVLGPALWHPEPANACLASLISRLPELAPGCRIGLLPFSANGDHARRRPEATGAVIQLSRSEAVRRFPSMRGRLPQHATRIVLGPLVRDRTYHGLLYAPLTADHATGDTLEAFEALCGYTGFVLAQQHLELAHERAVERQRLLDEISTCLQQTLDLDLLIQRIMEEVNRAIDAEAQSVWLVEEDEQRISCRFANGPGAETVRTVAVPLGEGIVGNTVLLREPIVVHDAQRDHRHSRRADQTTGITTRSLISVPMVREGKAIGALQAMNKRGGIPFTDDDVDLLRSIGDIAALAIENARLYADLQESYDTTLEALTAALDARDHETQGHSRRVVEYAVRLAEQAGMTRKEIQSLRRGALIHDIGKIAVPDAILRKPGPLTPEERRVMEQHPLTGHAMLRDIPHLRREIEVVLAHQERWDGAGYPFGLSGEEIPAAARVFSIVDTLDAITSDRPYRRGRSFADALEIIEAEGGKQFDPHLVSVFLEVPIEAWEAIRQSAIARRTSGISAAPCEKNAA